MLHCSNTTARFRFAAALALVGSLSAVAMGCGEALLTEDEFLYSDPEALKAADGGNDGEALADSAVTDGAGQTDTGGVDGGAADVASKDTATTDTGATDDCQTDFDCLNIKGKTPCKVPTCNKGTCELKTLAKDTVCTNPLVTLGECERTRCDDKGACAVQPKEELTQCGFGVCGKLCKAGKCVVATDEDYDDDNPCTKDYCKQGTEVVHEPITDLSLACDDENPCTENEYCAGGKCLGQATDCNDGFSCTVDACDPQDGCVHTANNASCDDGDPCTKTACELSEGCTVTGFADGASCDDGNACSTDDKCDDEGGCEGKNTCACTEDKDCDSKNLCIPLTCDNKLCVVDDDNKITCDDSGDSECAKAACDPAKGKCVLQSADDGTACDDGDACTTKSACEKGKCDGTGALDCNDNNPCTTDACDPADGCKNTLKEGDCNDDNACTLGDTCSDAGCIGTPKVCDDGVTCTADSCDPKTGDCAHKPTDAQCDDNNPCTQDSCGAKTDCENKANDSATCDDGDACTKDACKSGKCAVAEYLCNCKTAADCDDKNPCTTDSCDKGNCTNTASKDGTSCDTANKCNVAGSGACKAGKCEGGTPKDCNKGLSACETGACNPSTGACATLKKTDGTACDADGSGCTKDDVCESGQCVAGGEVDCGSLDDACNVGACESTGANTHKCAAKPRPVGTECDDGQFCTLLDKCTADGKCKAGGSNGCAEASDACNDGSCDAKAGKCVKEPKKSGLSCDDGAICTENDACDGKGTCVGGKPKACADGNCTIGSCDEVAKGCVSKSAPEGTECSDNNACTTEDRCDKGGKCVGAKPKECAGEVCKLASCDTKTGACQLKNGPDNTSCNDGNACTQKDLCKSGACQGTDPKTCAGDACNDGACNTSSGDCEKKPKPGFVGCNDGNACTENDVCKDGRCSAGKYTCACSVNTDCDDENVCTKDECVTSGGKKTCKNTGLTGAVCNDGKLCTKDDKCKSGSCQGADTNCNDGNACTADYCNAADGKCVNKVETGKACSDGNSCTTGDKCDANKACKGTPIPCNDGKLCTTDACKDGKCSYTNNTVSCNDGNVCTDNDRCDGGKCGGQAKNCDDKNSCTADSCNSANGCVHTATNAWKTCATNKFCVSTKCECSVTLDQSGTSNNETYYDAAQIPGGGAILVGRRYLGANKYDGLCRPIGRDGKYASNGLTYKGSSNDDYLRSVDKLKDGTFVAVGMKYLTAISDDGGWIVRLDSKCNLKANIGVTWGPDDQQLEGVKASDDGGAWAAGAYKKTVNVQPIGKFSSWVGVAVKLDSNLKIVKTVKLGEGDPIKKFKTYLKHAAKLPGNEAIVVGDSTYNSSKGSQDGAAARVTPSGGVKWFKRYGSSSTDAFRTMTLEGSSEAWLAGFAANKAWLVKIDINNGNMKLERKWGGNAENRMYGIGVWGGQRVIMGRTYDGNSQGSAIVHHFNSSGLLTRTRIFKATGGTALFEGMTFMEDQRPVIVGAGYDPGSKTMKTWYGVLGPQLETTCN